MPLIDAAVRNPVKTAVGVLIVVLFGTVALTRMPMQLMPEVETPTISVRTDWPGASPQEVEKEIVYEQEEQLQSVEGLTRMTSQSGDGSGVVTLEFRIGTRMDEAILKVNSRLQQVPDYPPGVERPVINTSNSQDRPIAWFLLRQDDASESDIDVTTLRRFAEDEIESQLERVPGVAQSSVAGGREQELQVIVDPEELAARQITPGQVRDVLAGRNIDISSGSLWEGKRRWAVRTLGRFESVDQVAGQLLAVRNGVPVYVRDVAEVRLGYQRQEGLVRRFGEPILGINCVAEHGANVLDVMTRIQQRVRQLNKDVLANQGLKLTQLYDETEYIDSALALVQQSLFIGGALTISVLMLFLHLSARTLVTIPLAVGMAFLAAYVSPWFFAGCLALLLAAGFWFARGALVVALAIPISVVGTFLALRALDRSLNVISLAGLAFAVGMIVDSAVVVLENIYRRREIGDRPHTAAVRGTSEVWGAIVASTLTTVAVFLPVVFVREEAGQLFGDIALAISIAVMFSLVVSITVIPTVSAKLLSNEAVRKVERDPSNSSVRRGHFLARIAAGFVTAVEWINDRIQGGFLRRLVLLVLLVGSSLTLSYVLWPSVDYMPPGNRHLVVAFISPPPGYNLDEVRELGKAVESRLRPLWETDPPVIDEFYLLGGNTNIFMGIQPVAGLAPVDLVPRVREAGTGIPGVSMVVRPAVLFRSGRNTTVNINISGPDLTGIMSRGREVLDAIDRVLPEAQARPIPSLEQSTPQVHIRPKPLQTAESLVDTADLGFAASTFVDGAYVGDYFLDNKRIDLVVKGAADRAASTQDVDWFPIATPSGQLVPLNSLADVSLGSGPEQVHHHETVRSITISVLPPHRMPLEQAIARINTEVVQPFRDNGRLTGGYRMTLSGTAGKLRETWTALRFNVLMALLITYLLMAALFESWAFPLVIIFSVPLGAVGGIVGLKVLNLFVYQPLDVLTMLGFVILIGTVVNNPILIVHQSLNLMRQDEMPPREAIRQSVRTRIRPIFMTTATTVFGLLPLVLFPGAGSELYRGLGAVVLGGLLVSTGVTLFLVPTLLSLIMHAAERPRRNGSARATSASQRQCPR